MPKNYSDLSVLYNKKDTFLSCGTHQTSKWSPFSFKYFCIIALKLDSVVKEIGVECLRPVNDSFFHVDVCYKSLVSLMLLKVQIEVNFPLEQWAALSALCDKCNLPNTGKKLPYFEICDPLWLSLVPWVHNGCCCNMVRCGQCCAHNPKEFLTSWATQVRFNASVTPDKDVYMTHNFIRSRRVWISALLLVVTSCPAVICTISTALAVILHMHPIE